MKFKKNVLCKVLMINYLQKVRFHLLLLYRLKKCLLGVSNKKECKYFQQKYK